MFPNSVLTCFPVNTRSCAVADAAVSCNRNLSPNPRPNAKSDPSPDPNRRFNVKFYVTRQGWGNFINVGVLLILLCICDVQSSGKQNSHPNRLGTVWRLAFGLGIIPIIGIWLYRVFVLKVRTATLLLCYLTWRASLARPINQDLSRFDDP